MTEASLIGHKAAASMLLLAAGLFSALVPADAVLYSGVLERASATSVDVHLYREER